MSSATDLSNLTTWAKEHITALYKATTHGEFEDVFNAFVASDIQVVFNGKRITRDEYKQKLEFHEGRTSEITFENSVSAPILDTQEPIKSGAVGIFYKANYKWISNGIRYGHIITSSLNITVKEEDVLPPPDRRRVFEVNQVTFGIAVL